MKNRLDVVLLSVLDVHETLANSAWALMNDEKEIFMLNLNYLDEELEALKKLAHRLPIDIIDATGNVTVQEALKNSGFSVQETISASSLEYGKMQDIYGKPQGLVVAPKVSVSSCISGAILAVRLRYAFLPVGVEDFKNLLSKVPGKNCPDMLPVVALHLPTGEDETNEHIEYIDNAASLKSCLENRGLHTDYLVMVNSADVEGIQEEGSSLGELKVQGLSLLGPLLASYRPVFPFDARTDKPLGKDIETEANAYIAAAGLKPKYRAILASPGYIPFIYEDNKVIGSSAEEYVRDIHIRLNNDLFPDVAEGRLFQTTPGGLSLQVLSSKHYPRINRGRRNTLVVTTPFVDKGIIFASDNSLITCQLEPLLKEAGCKIALLKERESHYQRVGEMLQKSDFFLYTGHGGPETLNTCGRYLTRKDLPDLPPLVAYASACSTMYLRPHLFSRTEGLDWEEICIAPRDVIGLSMVEKGAVCFVGGATSEDLQYSTSIYSIFMEALLTRGMSVGEALLETQNFISLFAQVMEQKAPSAARSYTYGTANAIHQQILLGDPALVPCPKKNAELALPQEVKEVADGYRVTVSIPPARWLRAKTETNEKKATRDYYKSREIEVISPYGLGVVSWGDSYLIAPDAEGTTNRAVMSSYLHMSLDLPLTEAPLGLSLIEAKEGAVECLLCGGKATAEGETTSLFTRTRVPYLMLPPSEMDMEDGWPFALEDMDTSLRLHWLAPLLVIDDRKRTAVLTKRLDFKIKTAPCSTLTGKISLPHPGSAGSILLWAGQSRSRQKRANDNPSMYPLAQTLTREDGSFTMLCPEGVDQITARTQFPLYQLPSQFTAFTPETFSVGGKGKLEIALKEVVGARVRGKIIDSLKGHPVAGALLRAWRGKYDRCGDPLVEGLAAETTTASDGSYFLQLPPGDYLLYIAAKDKDTLYKSQQFAVAIKNTDTRYVNFSLDQAAVVKGQITFEKEPLPFPATIKIKRFSEKGDGETLSLVPLQKNGTFECLVGFQDRFSIIICEEGWSRVQDTNSGHGFKLQPGEVLHKEYTLTPDIEGLKT